MTKSVLGNDPFGGMLPAATKRPEAAGKKPEGNPPQVKQTSPVEKPASAKPQPKANVQAKKPESQKKAIKTPAIKAKVARPPATEREKTETLPPAEPERVEIPEEKDLPAEMLLNRQPLLSKLLRPEGFTIGQEYGFDPGYRERLAPFLRFFYRFYWRVAVKGAENLPKDGQAVLVANHAGILPFDALMVANAVLQETKREVWPLIEDYFYYAPVLGAMLSRLGLVRACQENAQRLLKEDQLVLVFPEGIKGITKPARQRYLLQRFGRGGFVKLSLLTGAPIIPVAVIGSEEVHPVMANLGAAAKALGLPFFPVTPLFPWLGPLGLLPLPSKWIVRIGEPIRFAGAGAGMSQDRAMINRFSSEVKGRIQEMLDAEVGQRKSPWR